MTYKLDEVKVLIVDDMKPMLDLTSSVLKIFGFKNIQTAEAGDEAFDIICRFDPDIIITDWLMEPVDGLELVRMIRASERVPNPYVPIILMTGFSAKSRVEKSRDSGVTEFLVKPFTAEDLYHRIAHVIEKPRQFVATEAFFGPDRRRKKIKDYQGPRRRDDDDTGYEKKQAPDPTDKNAVSILQQLRDEAKNI